MDHGAPAPGEAILAAAAFQGQLERSQDSETRSEMPAESRLQPGLTPNVLLATGDGDRLAGLFGRVQILLQHRHHFGGVRLHVRILPA